MHRSVIFLATLAALLAVNVVLAVEQTGDADVPEESRPKLNNSDSAGNDKKKREVQMQGDGVTGRCETAKGKRVDVTLVFFCEVQADGTPVAGDSAMIRVDEDSGERDMLKITPPEGREDIDKDPLSEDKLDPDGMLGRPEPTNPPMMPPPRRRRAANMDTEQTIGIDDIKQQSVSTTFDFDKRDGMGQGARVQFEIKVGIIESEGNVSIGSEVLPMAEGDMKIQVDITDYEFCGDGGRECLEEESETVGKALKVCFEQKGSSGESDDVEKEMTDKVDVGDKFRIEDGEVIYSKRVIANSVIYELSDGDITVVNKTFGEEKMRHFVCVSFPRPDDASTVSYTYDPTGSADDDEEDEDTTESGAARVTFTLIGWVLAAILKSMF